MTGKSPDAGQTGHRAGRRVTTVPSGVAAFAAGSLLAALGLSACGPDAAHAATVLRSARATTVELANGTSRLGTDGMTIPKDATVRTAPGGSASLVAAGRTVLLGSATGVTVLDGTHEQLRQGLVMVDARRAPGLALDAGAATVQTPRGGLTRVERGAVLRAAAFRRTLTVRATGRKAHVRVDALHQVQVPDGGLPGAKTALALTRDTWERRYALDLVTADIDLAALADGLDRNPASGDAVIAVLPASYIASAPAATGEPRSEAALSFVIARAAGGAGVSVYDRVRELRAEGGSWGVVAALVGADVAKVSAALDAVLNATGGPATLAGAVGPSTPGSLLGGTGSPTGGPVVTATGRPRPSTGPTRRPSSSPSADPVQDVVTTVTHLLPTPVPTPVLGLPGATPSPTPLLSVQVGPVQVGLGG